MTQAISNLQVRPIHSPVLNTEKIPPKPEAPLVQATQFGQNQSMVTTSPHHKRMIFRFGVISAVASGFLLMGTGALAFENSEPHRLGAFAGAMRYCENNHEGPQRRFRWARLRAAQEIAELDRFEKRQALAARDRALARGRFFGEPLNSPSCWRLLRLSEWQRFHQN